MTAHAESKAPADLSPPVHNSVSIRKIGETVRSSPSSHAMARAGSQPDGVAKRPGEAKMIADAGPYSRTTNSGEYDLLLLRSAEVEPQGNQLARPCMVLLFRRETMAPPASQQNWHAKRTRNPFAFVSPLG